MNRKFPTVYQMSVNPNFMLKMSLNTMLSIKWQLQWKDLHTFNLNLPI